MCGVNLTLLGCEEKILSKLLVEKGVALKRQGHIPEAIETYQQALKLATKTKDRKQQAVIQTNLAIIENEAGHLERADIQRQAPRAGPLIRGLSLDPARRRCVLHQPSLFHLVDGRVRSL